MKKPFSKLLLPPCLSMLNALEAGNEMGIDHSVQRSHGKLDSILLYGNVAHGLAYIVSKYQ